MSAVKYSVTSAYERLVQEMDAAANRANAGTVRFRSSFVPCFARNAEGVTFDCFLVLENWKWRGAETSERVTIVMQAHETMTPDVSSILTSVVVLSYYDMKEGKPSLLHSVHYDFGRPLDCHPTFHAQLTHKPIVLPEKESTELNCSLTFTDEKSRCFKNARIPTSDMTFGSVLVCLAADHIGGSFFTEFRDKALEIQNTMPRPDYTFLQNSIAANLTHLRSSHWFAHQ
jgi:hypothetical protein